MAHFLRQMKTQELNLLFDSLAAYIFSQVLEKQAGKEEGRNGSGNKSASVKSQLKALVV